jgi:transposase
MQKRRKFSSEFKARVALEALSGVHTMAELSTKHGVHPNMIANWKRRAQEHLPELFSKKLANVDTSKDAEIKELHAKIGQLTVENDFLAKAFGR